ncbi:hypothetical protein AXF42_Ash005509 [Apostasia shenzhenica]|uniref:UBA domain-containing protein n=1 Tax=Apostasia shenzhenica TaxID=1088818 RepID=A0A2I0B733_9ASPA|nr:hypothetical protein AXF42_Ash005509 [Apostasia shenzhenica]
MDYDYRNRAGPPYRPAAGVPGVSSLYPRIGQGAPQQAGRGPPYQQSAPSSSSGLGIRVVLKPEYRLNPSPQLAPQLAEVPRCAFQFDFDFEKRILAEAEKENHNWSKLASEGQPSKESTLTPTSSTGNPVVDKYVTEGLPRDAASLGVLNYGDNPLKVREFVKGYNLLREMGFASKNVAEALAMYDNDTDKAIAHFLNSSS